MSLLWLLTTTIPEDVVRGCTKVIWWKVKKYVYFYCVLKDQSRRKSSSYTLECTQTRFSLGSCRTMHLYWFCAIRYEWLPHETCFTKAFLTNCWTHFLSMQNKLLSTGHRRMCSQLQMKCWKDHCLPYVPKFRKEEKVVRRTRSDLILWKNICISVRNVVRTAYGRITQLQNCPVAPLWELAGNEMM